MDMSTSFSVLKVVYKYFHCKPFQPALSPFVNGVEYINRPALYSLSCTMARKTLITFLPLDFCILSKIP